jgi:hypothetical protein
LVLLRSVGVFNRTLKCDKKIGVFVRFSCAASPALVVSGLPCDKFVLKAFTRQKV